MLVKPQNLDNAPKIKVIGVGGGGNNAINTMISVHNISGVDFISVNTDSQALKNSLAENKIQIGAELTKGLGSGGVAMIGKQAAEESVDLIHEYLAGSDMVFITAGLCVVTRTGASSVIAGIAKNLGALTIGVVTKPFVFEGQRRSSVAMEGIDELKGKVDTLIVVPNQRLLDIIDRKISFLEAMRMVDDVLGQGVKSISDLITKTGMINVDFADVKSVMSNAGTALMGMGIATGESRAQDAARAAISSPLLEVSINGATGILFNITSSADLSMSEFDEAAQVILEAVDPEANIIFGTTIDESIQDESIKINVLATGFNEEADKKILKHVEKKHDNDIDKTDNDTYNDIKEDNVDDEEYDTPAFLRRVRK